VPRVDKEVAYANFGTENGKCAKSRYFDGAVETSFPPPVTRVVVDADQP